MRQVHRAGEKLFVDFAGPTLERGDGTRGHLFVAAMGASHYTYARALSGQTARDWIRGMTGALHHMRGAPEFIVPDNPRAVVAQPDRYEPRVNGSALDFAHDRDDVTERFVKATVSVTPTVFRNDYIASPVIDRSCGDTQARGQFGSVKHPTRSQTFESALELIGATSPANLLVRE